ncbi:MAG: UDP-2,3-diacylglucosamine diphosphatase, partial [Myxococcota bacterium]|nr:UDP-2,3-diacylglucosamine diphosphatase [Myxococcota bacterium]
VHRGEEDAARLRVALVVDRRPMRRALHHPLGLHPAAPLDGLDADRLVLLGDVFHHWWGFPDTVMEPYAPCCAALLRARERGVRIQAVRGNHDFALGPFFTEQLSAEILDTTPLVLDGVRFVFAHGDEADTSLGYRLTRLTLRSWPFAAFLRLLGPDRAYALLRRLAGDRDHRGAPSELQLARQRSWAETHVNRGADVVVLGHLHAPGSWTIGSGQLFRLGDWSQGPVWLEIENGQPRLMR